MDKDQGASLLLPSAEVNPLVALSAQRNRAAAEVGLIEWHHAWRHQHSTHPRQAGHALLGASQFPRSSTAEIQLNASISSDTPRGPFLALYPESLLQQCVRLCYDARLLACKTRWSALHQLGTLGEPNLATVANLRQRIRGDPLLDMRSKSREGCCPWSSSVATDKNVPVSPLKSSQGKNMEASILGDIYILLYLNYTPFCTTKALHAINLYYGLPP